MVYVVRRGEQTTSIFILFFPDSEAIKVVFFFFPSNPLVSHILTHMHTVNSFSYIIIIMIKQERKGETIF